MTSLKEERACHQSRFPHLQELTEHLIFNASVGSRALSAVGQQLSSSAAYPITAGTSARAGAVSMRSIIQRPLPDAIDLPFGLFLPVL